jgi:phospholipase C
MNAPYDSFVLHNNAETIFERLHAARLPWRVYVDLRVPFSLTGIVHRPRLRRFFASHFSRLDDFFDDAERGRLPAYSFIEPDLLHAHNDYHPAYNALFNGQSTDSQSSVLGGEELLARVYDAVRTSSAPRGSNFANTLLMISFDEHGGNYDHVVPPRAAVPDPAAPLGQLGFRFDRLGVRVPAVAVSAYIDQQSVVTREYQSTSVIATISDRWKLGAPLTARDAAAPVIAPVLSRGVPRAQEDWPEVRPRPLPQQSDASAATDKPLPPLGKYILGAAMALDTRETRHVPGLDPETATIRQAVDYLNDRMIRIWPGLVKRPG